MESIRKFDELGLATSNFGRVHLGFTIRLNLAALSSGDDLPQFLHVLGRDDFVPKTAQHEDGRGLGDEGYL